MKRRLLKKSDLWLLIIPVLLAALLFIPNGGAAQAVVRLNGEEVERVDMAGVEGEKRFTVGGCEIVVTRDYAAVVGAECPDKTCVHTGKLTKPGQSAVCVPGRVTLTIEGGEENDAVAY